MSNCILLTKDTENEGVDMGLFDKWLRRFGKSDKQFRETEVQSSSLNSSDFAALRNDMKLAAREVVAEMMNEGKAAPRGRLKWADFVSGVLVGVALLVIGLLVVIPAQHEGIKGDIGKLQTTVENQTASINTMQTTVQRELGGIAATQQTLMTAIQAQKYNSANTLIGLESTKAFADAINFAFNSRDSAYVVQTVAVYSDYSTVLARDVATGQKYTATELSSQKLLVPYHNDKSNEDVFFYGQFDDKGYWDGDCIINIYENGNLKLIVEAEYSSGKMLYSQQVFHYELPYSRDKRDVWAISNRRVAYDSDGSIQYSSGYTRLYSRDGVEYPQRFKTEDVAIENILSVKQFSDNVDLKLYAYYFGNTKDGYFNDDTGDSYMIYFSPDHTVNLLYVGDFADGTMNDGSGDAWWIVEDKPSVDGCYGYYKGKFKNGRAIDDYKQTYEYNISQQRINEIIAESGKLFSYELKWRDIMSTT